MKRKSATIVFIMSLVMVGAMANEFNAVTRGSNDTKDTPLVLGMVLLQDTKKIDFNKIADELKNTYKLTISDQSFDTEKGIGVIVLKNSRIAIAMLPLPVPATDLEFPTQIAYLWPEAKDLIPRHKAHVIISVSSSVDTKLDMFKTFTKVAASVLANTNSMGIYLGSQTLVLAKDFYIEGAKSMTDDSLPLMNWIYFGFTQENKKSSGYTYGLKELGHDEIEIIESNHTLEEIQEMLFNIAHYVVQGNVTLRDGETIGLTASQKIKIKKSKGVLLDGTTLKIAY